VIEGAIASDVDTIPQRRFIKAVKKSVADRDISDLLWKFLRAGVPYQGNVSATLTGTPQGGIVSPLAANLSLHALATSMESASLHLTPYQRSKRRKQGKGNVRYVSDAEDFVGLCHGTKAEAHAIKEELKTCLRTRGLTLSEDKTHGTHLPEGFTFLGYRIIRGVGESGKIVPKVWRPDSAIAKCRDKIRGMLAPRTINDSRQAKLEALNRVIRGWGQDSRATSRPVKTFSTVHHALFWDMAHWLGRTYQGSMPAVMRRSRIGNTCGTKTLQWVRPTAFTAKRLRRTPWHHPYTAKEAMRREKLRAYDALWTGKEDRPGWQDLREEVILTKGTTCYGCGTILHPSAVEIDHVTPRARCKDPTETERMKHLQPICTSCHRAKTQSDLKVLSRMPSKGHVRFSTGSVRKRDEDRALRLPNVERGVRRNGQIIVRDIQQHIGTIRTIAQHEGSVRAAWSAS
jgi:5-methylcytosine-specific restriction endonuclease McrA